MSDLVRNPEARFSRILAHFGTHDSNHSIAILKVLGNQRPVLSQIKCIFSLMLDTNKQILLFFNKALK